MAPKNRFWLAIVGLVAVALAVVLPLEMWWMKDGSTYTALPNEIITNVSTVDVLDRGGGTCQLKLTLDFHTGVRVERRIALNISPAMVHLRNDLPENAEPYLEIHRHETFNRIFPTRFVVLDEVFIHVPSSYASLVQYH
jgi:hypothetical protein